MTAAAEPTGLVYVIDEIVHAGAGTERQVLNLLGGLDRERFRPHLVALRPSAWLSGADLGLPVRAAGVTRIKSPRFVREVRQFARFLRDERIEIVQTFFPDANVFGVLGARLARTPVVIQSRRNLGHDVTAFDAWILRRLRRWTTHYLANSRAAADVAIDRERLDPARVSVIHNGLDPARFAPRDEAVRAAQRKAWGVAPDDVLVGCLANLRAVKNLDALIDAAAALRDACPDARYVVVGEGGERARLEARIASEGLGDRFRLAGHLANVGPALAAFDIGVLPSKAEGFSNAVCEYLAAGLPAVVSSVGGNVEAVADGRTGYHFPPERSDVLAAKLRAVFEDPALRRRLGEAARADASSRFTLEASLRAHEAFYERALGRARP